MNRPAEPAAATPAVTKRSTSRFSWVARSGRVFVFVVQRANEEKLLQVASSLTFTTVLAIVPMLAVVLSLFTAFPVFQEFRVALEDFLTTSLMPPSVSDNIMDYLNQFAHQASRLTAIGGAFLLVTSLLLIMTIDQAFNDIWRVSRQRPLPQRALVYWAIITLGPVLAGGSLWATSFVARESLGLIKDVPEVVSVAISFIPLVLTGLGFAALFVVVPNRDVLWRDALIGGSVTAIVLEIMKSAFAFYLTRFPTYTVIYGAFATLPIFLLWIYLSWLAVLLGATLASSAPLIRLGRWHINRYPGASFVDALAALRALRKAQLSTPGGVAANTLASQLRLHQDELNEVLETLSAMGLVTRSPEDNWMLTCDARTTSMAPVVDRFLIDRSQPRVRNDPDILRVASSVISPQTTPTLEELCGEAQNTDNDVAPVLLQLGANKK
ncbi:YihY family inner membrane protein [Achromobacter sp. MFA1 R4]|uniref:YihY family inner membrane protein n=1 Tax=Achromobacter sp. MFA1 R4 TaxID=1881016 RepID=UPI0009537FC5|nr:YihY family inner membrane protein [Achromobacter sp. MFA1 R4]SIT33365.1 tRNA-processing RNAse BN [Achromobacter sp. MFA1 R4]